MQGSVTISMIGVSPLMSFQILFLFIVDNSINCIPYFEYLLFTTINNCTESVIHFLATFSVFLRRALTRKEK